MRDIVSFHLDAFVFSNFGFKKNMGSKKVLIMRWITSRDDINAYFEHFVFSSIRAMKNLLCNFSAL